MMTEILRDIHILCKISHKLRYSRIKTPNIKALWRGANQNGGILQGFLRAVIFRVQSTKDGSNKRKYPVNSSSLGENVLLMLEVRGE